MLRPAVYFVGFGNHTPELSVAGLNTLPAGRCTERNDFLPLNAGQTNEAMNTQDRNPERQDRKRQLDKLTEEDLTKSERDLSPETNKHRPFPESPISKDQRKETEDVQRESEDLEQLADDVEGTVGSRQTD